MVTIAELKKKLDEYPDDWIIDFRETGATHSLLALTITQNRSLYYSGLSKKGDYTVHDADMTVHMIVKAPDEKSGGW